MSAIEIILPEELKQFADAEAANRGFRTTSDYIRSLLEADRIRNMTDNEIEKALLEAIDGPSSPLTTNDFDDIRRKGDAIIARRRRR